MRRSAQRSRAVRLARRTLPTLPAVITLGNLLCGFLAIFVASRPPNAELPLGGSPIGLAGALVLLGMVCDALDGRIARLTASASRLGEQLDSMADMVTFGAAPAFIAVQVVGVQTPFVAGSEQFDTWFDRLGLMVAAAFVACAALRLARFNAELHGNGKPTSDPDETPDDAPEQPDPDPDTHDLFIGLPSPAAAGTVVALALLHQHALAGEPSDTILVNVAALGMVIATLLCALAMVSRLPYVHVFNRYVRRRATLQVLGFTITALLLAAVYPQVMLAALFLGYATLGPVLGRRALRSA